MKGHDHHDAFEDVEPDDEFYEESRVVYYRTVFLAMPKESRLSCFMTPTSPITETSPGGSVTVKGPAYIPDVTGWIDRLLAKRLTRSSSPEDLNDLEMICQDVLGRLGGWKAVKPNDPPPHPDADLARVITACVELDKKEMFLTGFKLCPAKVPSSMFRVSQHLSALNQLSSRFDIINALKEGVAEESQRSPYDNSLFQKWTQDEADKAVSANEVISTGTTSASDGVLLAKHCATLTPSAMVNKYG
ncbi:hypothetical protein IFR05_011232 [Cadophora sp. M221]|nr:hypothetical protein IFR05_011232 [Cadophora sp. M221]